jgi:hypothetical protein
MHSFLGFPATYDVAFFLYIIFCVRRYVISGCYFHIPQSSPVHGRKYSCPQQAMFKLSDTSRYCMKDDRHVRMRHVERRLRISILHASVPTFNTPGVCAHPKPMGTPFHTPVCSFSIFYHKRSGGKLTRGHAVRVSEETPPDVAILKFDHSPLFAEPRVDGTLRLPPPIYPYHLTCGINNVVGLF